MFYLRCFNLVSWWALLGMFLMAPLLSYGQSAAFQDSPVISIPQSDWYHRWGDSPVDEAGKLVWLYDDTSSPGWSHMSEDSPLLSNPPGNRFLWLMIPAPDGRWKHPALLLPFVSQSLEVYQNGQRIYGFGELEPANSNKYFITRLHLILLENTEAEAGLDTLFIRIYSNSRQIGIDKSKIWLGSITGLIKEAARRDIENLIVGPLLLLAGFFAIFIYFKRRKQKLNIVLSFGAYAICIGVAGLITNPIVQLSTGAVGIRYALTIVPNLLWPVALYIFIEQITGRGYMSLIRRIWQAHILLAVVAILLDVMNVSPMPSAMPVFFVVLMLGIFIAMPIVIIAAVRGNPEARIFSAGMGVIMLAGTHDILGAFGLNLFKVDLYIWSILVFVLLLAYILERRFAQAHRQLEEYSHTLEQKVEERTQELSEKNTALEKAYQELSETQSQMIMQSKMASLGDLVAGIAHEMNNPIGVIHSAADITRRGIHRLRSLLQSVQRPDEPDLIGGQLQQSFDLLEKNSETVTTAAERVANIVRSLRAFARLDEALFQEVDIHQNIDTTLTLLHHELMGKADVVKEYGDIPRIQCYPNELNQAFMNLLRNAGQAIQEQGTITISTYSDEAQVYVKVSDTGIGIPPEDRPKIFDPGFTTQGVRVGKGLGLSIVYNTVQKHQGETQVDSEVGRGTSITIALPIKQAGGVRG